MREIIQFSDMGQIGGKSEEFTVSGPIEMSWTEGTNPKSLLRIHNKVSSQVVKHDGIFCGVHCKFPPNYSKRFHLYLKL